MGGKHFYLFRMNNKGMTRIEFTKGSGKDSMCDVNPMAEALEKTDSSYVMRSPIQLYKRPHWQLEHLAVVITRDTHPTGNSIRKPNCPEIEGS